MDTFLENAQHIFDVARADESTEAKDFALLIRPDGGLHFVMESSVDSAMALEAAAIHGEARIAYRVTKTEGGRVSVAGRSGDRECVLVQHAASRRDSAHRFAAELLRDQPLYRISSPLTVLAPSSSSLCLASV